MSDTSWPQPGDKAFQEVTPPINFEQLCAYVDPSDAVYTNSFLWAANALIAKAELERAHENRLPDMALIPVAYLYRHYLELELKDICVIGLRRNVIQISDDRLTRHDLNNLWRSAKEVIIEVCPSRCNDDLKAVGDVVEEFHQFDKTGEAFRYSKDKKKKGVHLSNIPQWIDLKVLQATMGGVANFFEGAHAVMDAGDPCALKTLRIRKRI